MRGCVLIGSAVRGAEDRSRGVAAAQSGQRPLQLYASPWRGGDSAGGDPQDCRVRWSWMDYGWVITVQYSIAPYGANWAVGDLLTSNICPTHV